MCACVHVCTYVCQLDDEVSPLLIREHRQDVLSRLAVALPHQEVSLLPQQLLGFRARDGAVVPLLLWQGALRRGNHVKKLLRRRNTQFKSSDEALTSSGGDVHININSSSQFGSELDL